MGRLLAITLLAALGAGCVAPQASWRAPGRSKAAAPPPSQTAPTPTQGSKSAERVHVVAKGETLYRIATMHGVDLDELMDVNQIGDPRQLAVGRELVLPPQRRPPAQPPPPAQVAKAQGNSSGARAPPAQARAGISSSPPPKEGELVLAWPVKGVLYSRFGPRGASRHDGIDISAPEGTPIQAAADGVVIYSGVQRGYGNLVILGHEGNWVTIYAHNRENLVKEGAKVRKGQVIAKVGRTGRTTGPHLHFEVRKGTTPHDPLTFLPR